MRRIFAMLTLMTTVVVSAGAQQTAAGDHSRSAVSASCPLLLTDLNLTAPQQAVFDSIRATHRTEMMKLMPDHAKMMSSHSDMKMDAKMDMKMDMKMTMTPADSAAMERSMKRAVDGMRAILTDGQRTKFDAAVSAHEAKMAEKKDGDMMACCMECMKDMGHSDSMKAKKPDA